MLHVHILRLPTLHYAHVRVELVSVKSVAGDTLAVALVVPPTTTRVLEYYCIIISQALPSSLNSSP